jgi:hypothetical protein
VEDGVDAKGVMHDEAEALRALAVVGHDVVDAKALT